MLDSAQMDFYCNCYGGRKAKFNQKTWRLIDKLFKLINQIKSCGDDNLHTLWFSLKYAPIKDEDGEIYIDEYADENIWYKLSTSFHEFGDRMVKAIAINNKIIMQYISDEDNLGFEEDISELILCLIEKVNKIIGMMKKDEYNDYISKNLSYSKRYGTITRSDYYKIYEQERESYLKDISKNEIKEFEKLIKMQSDEKEIEDKLESFTANDFYSACYLGYAENKYEDVQKYSPKEAYYKYADGRDEDLKDIDIDSEEEFFKWYFDKNKFGGHPWEVCRGGNSTHIDLGVRNKDGKWYYFLRGKSWNRSIETIKFYLALRRKGLPVFLEDAQEILNRLLGKDKIGIVPDFVIPRYCESNFPNEKILDFMHLPYDENKAKMIQYAKWRDIEKQYLKQ